MEPSNSIPNLCSRCILSFLYTIVCSKREEVWKGGTTDLNLDRVTTDNSNYDDNVSYNSVVTMFPVTR